MGARTLRDTTENINPVGLNTIDAATYVGHHLFHNFLTLPRVAHVALYRTFFKIRVYIESTKLPWSNSLV